MPGALPLTGLYGKVPAHGDFVRRGLPTSFVAPWDAWLQAGIARAREGFGEHWPAAWDAAPAWRFALPAGACGPDAVAGVMLPSEDQVGRRFPITLAVLLPPGAPPPDAEWFDAVEAVAWAGRKGRADADALAAALPLPGAPLSAPPLLPADEAPAPADDVLALLAAGQDAGSPAGPPQDVLALPGAAEPPGEAIGAATPEALPPPGMAVPPADSGDEPPADVLALLGAAGAAAAPSFPADDADGTLAMLIGAGAPGTGPGDAPRCETDSLAALRGAEADPPAVPAADSPPCLSAPGLAAPPALPLPAEAPPAPDGGGWWTRGGPRVPPMVWPLAALPPAEDFAYLLEAEA